MKKIYLIIMMLAIAKFASAQEDEIKSQEIDIIKPYQPILADAVKISFVPQIEKNKTEKQPVSYDVPAKLMEIPYTAPSLKPAAMPKDYNKEELPSVYAKIGIGNYYSPYIDLIYTNTKNKNFNYGGEIFNYGAHSNDIKSRAIRQTAFTLFGTLYSKKFSATGNVKYENSKRTAYAMEVLGTSSDSVMRYHFNKISADVNLQNTSDLKLPFEWKSNVNPYYLSRSFNGEKLFTDLNGTKNLSEAGFNFNNQLSKRLKSNDQIIVNINWNWSELSIADMFTHFNYPYVSTKQTLLPETFVTIHAPKQPNNLLTINPFYKFNRKTWSTELGLNASFTEGVFVLMPHYESTKPLIENYLIFYTGWKGWVQKNSYLNLLNQCSHLSYTDLQNTYSQDSYMGVKGTDKKRISYNAKFTRLYYQHLGLFVNNDSVRGGELTMKYIDEATILNFHSDISYNQNEKLKLSAAFDYYNFYKLSKDITAWNFPPIKLMLNGSYKIADKIKVQASATTWQQPKTLLGTKTVAIKGDLPLDISLGATYNYTKYISGFVQVNNILNQQYQTFYGYKSFGLNAMLGVIFKY
jgi:hypothetical protein